nr:hypothetical protein 2 [bacterium]
MSEPMWNALEAYLDRPGRINKKTLNHEPVVVDTRQTKNQPETVRWEELIGQK